MAAPSAPCRRCRPEPEGTFVCAACSLPEGRACSRRCSTCLLPGTLAETLAGGTAGRCLCPRRTVRRSDDGDAALRSFLHRRRSRCKLFRQCGRGCMAHRDPACVAASSLWRPPSYVNGSARGIWTSGIDHAGRLWAGPQARSRLAGADLQAQKPILQGLSSPPPRRHRRPQGIRCGAASRGGARPGARPMVVRVVRPRRRRLGPRWIGVAGGGARRPPCAAAAAPTRRPLRPRCRQPASNRYSVSDMRCRCGCDAVGHHLMEAECDCS